VIGPFCNPKEIFQKKCKETNSELVIVEANSKIFDFNEENNNIAKQFFLIPYNLSNK